MKFILIGLVRLYQVVLAPLLRILNGGHGHCRHNPTCSRYAIEALQVHGAIKGTGLTVWRLLRCHPWGTHGYDPVPPSKSKIADKKRSFSHEEPCLCCSTETSFASQNNNSPTERTQETNESVRTRVITGRREIA